MDGFMSKISGAVSGVLSNDPPIVAKVKAVTSTESWGAARSAMAEIAQATFTFAESEQVMSALTERLGDESDWHIPYKAVELAEYLILNASDSFVQNLRRAPYALQQQAYASSREATRKKAQSVIDLMNDDAKLSAEREKAQNLRSKYQGFSNRDPLPPAGRSNFNSGPSNFGSNSGSNSRFAAPAAGNGLPNTAPATTSGASGSLTKKWNTSDYAEPQVNVRISKKKPKGKKGRKGKAAAVREEEPVEEVDQESAEEEVHPQPGEDQDEEVPEMSEPVAAAPNLFGGLSLNTTPPSATTQAAVASPKVAKKAAVAPAAAPAESRSSFGFLNDLSAAPPSNFDFIASPPEPVPQTTQPSGFGFIGGETRTSNPAPAFGFINPAPQAAPAKKAAAAVTSDLLFPEIIPTKPAAPAAAKSNDFDLTFAVSGLNKPINPPASKKVVDEEPDLLSMMAIPAADTTGSSSSTGGKAKDEEYEVIQTLNGTKRVLKKKAAEANKPAAAAASASADPLTHGLVDLQTLGMSKISSSANTKKPGQAKPKLAPHDPNDPFAGLL